LHPARHAVPTRRSSDRLRHRGRRALKRHGRLATSPARENDLATREIARPDLQTDGYAEALPLEVLGAGLQVLALVELHTKPGLLDRKSTRLNSSHQIIS